MLIVEKRLPNCRKENTRRWLCRCDCGLTTEVATRSLRSGHIRSCGCLLTKARASFGDRMRTHGSSDSREHHSWSGMKGRCNNPQNPNYKSYGGRGIKVCQRWEASFSDFLADMGICPNGMSLDRIDVHGDYEPSNCRWATSAEQAANKQNSRPLTINGTTMGLNAWAKHVAISPTRLYRRLQDGWTVEEALGIVPRPYAGRGPRSETLCLKRRDAVRET